MTNSEIVERLHSLAAEAKAGTLHADHDGWSFPKDRRLRCGCGEVLIPSRNPDPYTGAMFRAEHPNLTPGQLCPSCEDEDSSIAEDGVCYLCVCGCSYCEPDDG
ncbi:hypothetical protein [Gordonia terrae]|uniref:hypothetical protein n=1 Tax=Gordonia terrae TaxID=2055 RepID=UPI003F6D4EA7